ncbi:MAG: hypothetical protein IIX54_04895 [Clostridia bacterium]|nr:hypothetical protein [Clostridia bacterium]
MKLFLAFILLFLAVYGLSDILHSAKLLLFRPQKNNDFVVCLLDESSTELDLNYLVEDVSWKRANYNKRIVAVNYKGAIINANCLKFADKHSIKVLKPNELEDFINIWSS